MSGICSAHMGHDPGCPACQSTSPPEAARATAHFNTYRRGVHYGIESVCAWLEGDEWLGSDIPVDRERDLGGISEEQARELAQRIRAALAAAILSEGG